MARNTERLHLTNERIRKLQSPTGMQAVYAFDDDPRQLCVRVTPAGAKSFVYAGKLNRTPFRITIGSTDVWNLDDARDEARRLQVIVDQGKDPRQVAASEQAEIRARIDEQEAAKLALENAERRGSVTLSKAWATYIEARSAKWSGRHRLDHEKVIRPSRIKGDGEKARNLKAGVLASLAPLPMSAITPERIAEWLEAETPKRGTQAALAFRLLRAFINWCEDVPELRGIAAPNACARKISREHVQKAKAKDDALQREQLILWFDAIRRIQNPTISAYLQGLLITGARRNELASLRWSDVDFQWNSLTIHDKVDGERTIPLTPYFASLLRDLKNRNDTQPTVRRLKTLETRGEKWVPSPWVFSSQTSETGHIEEPSIQHRKACAAVGLSGLTLHGLRRSFGSLSEWCECPVGVVAQIQGHKPSATAEKHYRVRPIDLLRLWHTRIEGWLLEQAGVTQAANARISPQAVTDAA